MIQNDFGSRLRIIRRFRKLTQENISKQLNISRQAYSNYEQGRCLPPPDTLADLSVILGTNLFIPFLQYAINQHNIQSLSDSQEIPETEIKALVDIYSALPLTARTNLLECMLLKASESEVPNEKQNFLRNFEIPTKSRGL